MQLPNEHRQAIQHPFEDYPNYPFYLIRYPDKFESKAIYRCNAGHFFEMNPDEFLKNMECPVCRIDENVSRDSQAYKDFLREAKKNNNGLCELTGDRHIAVHHLYSIRKYPELAYHPDNAILLNKGLHKEYHRWNPPTNTNGYTFLAWLNYEAEKQGVYRHAIEQLSEKTRRLMGTLEREIGRVRGVNFNDFPLDSLNDSITYLKSLQKMENKAGRLVENIDSSEAVEIVDNTVFILNLYWLGIVVYRNNFGNWHDYNPTSGSIQKHAFDAVMAARRKSIRHC